MVFRRIAGATLTFASLLGLLTACGLFAKPSLQVTPTSIPMTANSATFTVGNNGDKDSVLNYHVTTSDPSVSVSPSSGAVDAGQTATLACNIAFEMLSLSALQRRSR